MAVSQIEEKILGRLARESAPSNPLLAASLYQVLGLSILLSRKLYRARRVRRLDISRDTKSLQLYHQILWLAREGLSITEVYILPYCQNGEQGPECRVMAAKLRASLYHVFCLFHNHPPVQQLTPPSAKSSSSNSNSPKNKSPEKSKSPRSKDERRRRRRASKNALRDPIPSMTSETSYVTNPYATTANAATPPLVPGASEARRTPSRPPGLQHIEISPTRAAASFLLPPLNFVSMAKEYFETAQQLADTLLSAASGLRLSISLEHSSFMWECEKRQEHARKLARQAIRDVYASTDGLDDDEFADASALVQALGGIVRRGTIDPPPRRAADDAQPPVTTAPIHPASSRGTPVANASTTTSTPSGRRSRIPSPSQQRSFTRTPERLSTVAEDPSQETSETAPTTLSPSVSRLSNRSRSRLRRKSSASSKSEEKAAKRRVVEQAEDMYRRSSSARSRADSVASVSMTERAAAAAATAAPPIPSLPAGKAMQPASDTGDAAGQVVDTSRPHSRQNTPPEGSKGRSSQSPMPLRQDKAGERSMLGALERQDSARSQAREKRFAVLEALRAMSTAHRRLGPSMDLDEGAGLTR